MKEEKKNPASPSINVTPLIDVLLVLLIIFMVAAPTRYSRFKTLIPEPPQPDPLPVIPRDTNLRVDISSDEKLMLNGNNVGSVADMSPLIERLSGVLKERERLHTVDLVTGNVLKTVYIKAPRSINYGEVAKVIDTVKTAGADPVGLQVDELEQ
jgi:biopolymer transport protein ExbD